MKTASISALAGAALIAATSTALAGPMNVARLDNLIAPLEDQIEPVHYSKKKHRHARRARRAPAYAVNPGAAVAGTALGLLGLGAATAAGAATVATGGWCDLWGRCYYRPYYYRPYYYGYYRPYYYRPYYYGYYRPYPYRYAYWW